MSLPLVGALSVEFDIVELAWELVAMEHEGKRQEGCNFSIARFMSLFTAEHGEMG